MNQQGYIALLERICRYSPEEYVEVFRSTGGIADAVVQLGDRDLAKSLSRAKRDKALMLIKRKMYELGIIEWNPRDGGYHKGSALAALARRRGLPSEKINGATRLRLIQDMQKAEGSEPCIGKKYRTCRQTGCLWRRDCREIQQWPFMGSLRGADTHSARPIRAPSSPARSEGGGTGGKTQEITDDARTRGSSYIERRPRVDSPPSGAAGDGADGQKRFLFANLSATLQFLDMTVSNGRPWAGLRNSLIIRVMKRPEDGMVVTCPALAQDVYARLRDAAKLLGGIEPHEVPAGRDVNVNRLLECITLSSRPRPADNIECLIVNRPGGSLDDIAELYRSLPRGACGECAFFPALQRGPDKRHGIILLQNIREIDRVRSWIERLGPGTDAFYPIGGATQDTFYCQWGFAYLVTQLPRLYDVGDSRYVLMGTTGSSARPWLRISRNEAQEAFIASNEVFRIALNADIEDADPVELESAGDSKCLDLELKVTRSSRDTIAGAARLAREISLSRRRLVECEASYDRLKHSLAGQCRIALVFQQTEGQSLPSALKRFLGRSYRALSAFSYCFVRTESRAMHVIISRTPVALAEALAAGADGLYVQDATWQRIGLCIFLRHGVSTSPLVDDPVVATQFRQLLSSADGEDALECCLADMSHPDGGRRAPRLVLVPIRKTSLLQDKITCLNEEFAADIRAAVQQVQSASEGTLEIQRLAVDARLRSLQKRMQIELQKRLDDTLEQWERLHARTDRAVQEMQASGEDIASIEELLSAIGPTWEQFVERIIALHLMLSADRRGAFARMEGKLEEFGAKAAQARKANEDAVAKIASARTLIKNAKADLTAIEGKTRSAFGRMTEEHRKYKEDRSRLSEDVAGARKRLRALTLKSEQQKAAIEKEVRDAEADRAGLDRSLLEKRQLQAKLQSEKTEIARREESLSALEKGIAQTASENDARKEALRRRTEEYGRNKARMKKKAEQLEERKRTRDTRIATGKKVGEGKLTFGYELASDRGRFHEDLTRIIHVLKNRPSLIERVRFMFLLNRLLKNAPSGFYSTERPDYETL